MLPDVGGACTPAARFENVPVSPPSAVSSVYVWPAVKSEANWLAAMKRLAVPEISAVPVM